MRAQAIDLIDEAGSRVRIAAYNARKRAAAKEDPKVDEYLQVRRRVCKCVCVRVRVCVCVRVRVCVCGACRACAGVGRPPGASCRGRATTARAARREHPPPPRLLLRAPPQRAC
jgi:hypothetical protein